MPQCTFCGFKEDKKTPVCQTCGALRYPIEKTNSTEKSTPQKKLKISAAIAAAIVTPGSFIVLAVAGIAHLKKKKNTGQ